MNRRRKILVVTGIVLSAAVLLPVIHHYQLRAATEAYLAELKAKGEPTELSQVLPPTVPQEANGKEVVRAAFALLVSDGDDYGYFTNLPPAMHMIAPGRAMVGWAQPDVRGFYTGYYTNNWENVKAAAETNRPGTELLKQAMDYPTIDFQPDYGGWPAMPLEHLTPLRHCARKLSLATMCNLHEGDAASATTNLCAILALVRGIHDERTILSQHTRKSVASTATAGTWELLQSTNVTDAELALLQRSWERIEFIKAAANSFLVERACMESTIRKMRASGADFDRFAGIFGLVGRSGSSASGNWLEDFKHVWGGTKLAGAKFMWRTSWSYSDELQALQGDQIIWESMRIIETNKYFNPAYTNMLNQLQTLGITNDPNAWFLKRYNRYFRQFFSEDVVISSRAIEWTMAAEASRRIVITAIALKRYQLRHGNYPADLNTLVPEYLPTVPHDPVDGQPLHYRRNTDGTFTLYSVGRNGIDDGGDPLPGKAAKTSFFNWLNPDAVDWVWPQPATPEEVQFYYEHPPK